MHAVRFLLFAVVLVVALLATLPARATPAGNVASLSPDVAGLPSWAAPQAPPARALTPGGNTAPNLPGAPAPAVPIDGGLSLLFAAGAGLAVRRLRATRALAAAALLLAATGAQAQTTVTTTLTGGPGWRILGAPVTGMTVADLASQNLVQGVTGQYPTAGDNLFLSYNGLNGDNTGDNRNGFAPAASTSDPLVPGRGFLWYFYDQNLGPAAGGTSQSYALPRALSATGGTQSNVTLGFGDRLLGLGQSDGFYMIANPFETAFDISGVFASGVGVGSLQAAFQIWDPNSGQTVPQGSGTPGSYVILNRIGELVSNSVADDIAPWQGLFAEVNTLLATNLITSFSFDRTFMVGTAPPIYGRTATGDASQIGVLRFRLGGATASGQAVYDAAATLAFTDVSTFAWDLYDATKRPSMDSPATIAPVGAGRDGVAVSKAQEALPIDLTRDADVPLRLTAAEAGTFTLAWTGLDELPASWTVELTDMETGAVVDLRRQSELVFTAEAAAAGTTRFAVAVRPGTATAGEAPAGPDAADLSPVGPNPTADVARATLRVGTAQAVTADLYDLLGRRVARVFDGAVAADAPVALSVDSRDLAPGTYVLRVAGETFSASRRLTVAR